MHKVIKWPRFIFIWIVIFFNVGSYAKDTKELLEIKSFLKRYDIGINQKLNVSKLDSMCQTIDDYKSAPFHTGWECQPNNSTVDRFVIHRYLGSAYPHWFVIGFSACREKKQKEERVKCSCEKIKQIVGDKKNAKLGCPEIIEGSFVENNEEWSVSGITNTPDTTTTMVSISNNGPGIEELIKIERRLIELAAMGGLNSRNDFDHFYNTIDKTHPAFSRAIKEKTNGNLYLEDIKTIWNDKEKMWSIISKINKIAKEITRKQMLVLEGAGDSFSRVTVRSHCLSQLKEYLIL